MLGNMLAKTLKCNVILNWWYCYDSCSSRYNVELSFREGIKEGSECGS